MSLLNVFNQTPEALSMTQGLVHCSLCLSSILWYGVVGNPDLLPSAEGQSPAAWHWGRPRLVHALILAAASSLQPLAYAGKERRKSRRWKETQQRMNTDRMRTTINHCWRDSSPKKENSVIIYSPSSWHTFLSGAQKEILRRMSKLLFSMQSKRIWTRNSRETIDFLL